MIVTLADIEIRLGSAPWPEMDGGRAAVDAHWARATADNPKLWNGRVLGTVAPGWPGGIAVDEAGRLTGTAIETDFAAFLAWRDFGYPEIGLRNLFGSALVLGGDGALVYGVMGSTTANAGRIYPPGGSLEPDDARADGLVDVRRSIRRELAEETGLDAGDARPGPLLASFDGTRVSIGEVFRFDASADEIAGRIRAFIAAEADPELDDVRVIRSLADLPADGRCPVYAAQHARRLIGG